MEEIESRRLAQQVALDAERSAVQRNKWGQFATPPALADQIVHAAIRLHGDGPITFLEPSVGSGSFFSAVCRNLQGRSLDNAVGIELDERFANAARDLWSGLGLDVRHCDFTEPGSLDGIGASLLVANPPYVRHHHLTTGQKKALPARIERELGIRPSGLSGLYVYFVLLAHAALKPGAISAWLIPSEFMDVNYGRAIKEYLSNRVTIRAIHRYDAADVQFDDALVTSAVVIFENTPPSGETLAEFSYGGSIEKPRLRRLVEHRSLKPTTKWSAYFQSEDRTEHSGPTMGDYIKVSRGIATGDNKFFSLPLDEALERGFQRENLLPLLPSPRDVRDSVIEADEDGWPINPAYRRALINTGAPLDVLDQTDPSLAQYLRSAPEKVLSGFLVSKRTPWYRQEQRTPAPFLSTYMGRGCDEKRPFRFILNHSRAIVTNTFLMLYPTPLLAGYIAHAPEALTQVHKVLQTIAGDDLRSGGRVYGGGLNKMEPKELMAMSGAAILALAPDILQPGSQETLPLPASA